MYSKQKRFKAYATVAGLYFAIVILFCLSMYLYSIVVQIALPSFLAVHSIGILVFWLSIATTRFVHKWYLFERLYIDYFKDPSLEELDLQGVK